jgi:hypothetical protein
MQYEYNKFCHAAQLIEEIETSSITTNLIIVSTSGNTTYVEFSIELNNSEKTILDALVNNHIPIYPEIPVQTQPVEVVSMPSQTPYASKTIVISGVTKKLYKRFTGISQALSAGSNTFTWTQANYPWVKFMGIEVVGAETGDTCSFYILDTATGTFSGVPNYQLNQFGYSVNIAKDFYKRLAEYDADIYQGLQFKFVYTSISAKTIYINFDMNEVKSS